MTKYLVKEQEAKEEIRKKLDMQKLVATVENEIEWDLYPELTKEEKEKITEKAIELKKDVTVAIAFGYIKAL